MYQHVGADSEMDTAVAWDSADGSAPHQPPKPDRESGKEEEEEEEGMDTTSANIQVTTVHAGCTVDRVHPLYLGPLKSSYLLE